MPTSRLSQISSPGTFRCREIQCQGEEAVRLKRMGICSGRLLRVVQVGDPMILLVVGARIGISRKLASCIEIESAEIDMSGATLFPGELPVLCGAVASV